MYYPYGEDEITIRDFFDKLQDKLMMVDPNTGEKQHRYTRDREIIAALKSLWDTDVLDNKLHDRNAVFNMLFTLHYLRRGIYEIIKDELKSKTYKEECLRDFKNLDREFYENIEKLK